MYDDNDNNDRPSVVIGRITAAISARSGNIFASDRDFFLICGLIYERELQSRESTYDELIYWTALSAGSVKKKIKYLVDKGYVEEQPDAEDKRRVNFSLTAKTRKLLSGIEENAVKDVKAALAEGGAAPKD